MSAAWFLHGFFFFMGAALGVLACSLPYAAHLEAPSRLLLGKCRDCGGPVFEDQEFVVRHVRDCEAVTVREIPEP